LSYQRDHLGYLPPLNMPHSVPNIPIIAISNAQIAILTLTP
jgi:hypothetical protein